MAPALQTLGAWWFECQLGWCSNKFATQQDFAHHLHQDVAIFTLRELKGLNK